QSLEDAGVEKPLGLIDPGDAAQIGLPRAGIEVVPGGEEREPAREPEPTGLLGEDLALDLARGNLLRSLDVQGLHQRFVRLFLASGTGLRGRGEDQPPEDPARAPDSVASHHRLARCESLARRPDVVRSSLGSVYSALWSLGY